MQRSADLAGRQSHFFIFAFFIFARSLQFLHFFAVFLAAQGAR